MKTISYYLFVIIFLCAFTDTFAQKFFIRFTDKNGSSYTTSNPSDFLSARSIARRINQGVVITTEDLPVNSNYIDSVIAKGALILTKSKWFNGVTVQCDSTVLSNILALPFVLNATNVLRHGKSTVHKSDWLLNSPNQLRTASYNYGGSFNQIHLMNGEYLHNLGYTGAGMLVAVIDAGFANVDQLSTFDSLRLRNGIVATWDFVDNQSSVYEDDAHGMAVLSTMAGNTPGQLVGTSPDANFILLRTEDVFTENIIEEYNWNAAAEFADSAGADLITSSLGYTDFDDAATSHTYADMNGHTCPSSIAANRAFSKGILVCTSAGNSGNNSWHYLSAPSDGDDVLSVGAVDDVGNFVSFSSYGPASDGDIKPNVAAKGLGSTIADLGNTIGTGSGTSFSCPILAGSATCLLQANPISSVADVKSAIERSANYYLTPTDTLGYGIPNFGNADLLLGTRELSKNNLGIIIYPNPINDKAVFQFSTLSGNSKMIIYNVSGSVVSTYSLDKGKSELIIDLSQFANGVYACRIEDKNYNGIQKFIVIH